MNRNTMVKEAASKLLSVWKKICSLAWKKKLLIAFAVVLVLGGAGAAYGVHYARSMLQYVNRAEYDHKELSDEELEAILGNTVSDFVEADLPTVPVVLSGTNPTEEILPSDFGSMDNLVNVMLIGQAYREGENTKLADTMILCTLNRDTNTLTMTSFLRDLYVQLPNYRGKSCGMQRINVAYNLGWHWAGDLGGMEMLDMLILNNFGVEVDHNIEINFNTMVAMVNKLGGVSMELTADEAKYLTQNDQCKGSFEEGENLLKGDAALAYARMRKSNASDNDFNRTARQRKMIIQIIKQCTSMSMTELDELLKYILPMVLTDMSDEEIMDLAMMAISMLPSLKIVSNQCPAEGTYWGEMVKIDGIESGVLRCNTYSNMEILTAIAERGEPLPEKE